ncbi:MAG: hypothetical protein ACD_65C00350G0003 [uncultured bacterium]|nr:MAG: hypothetical protein ACD_65C00350G0003 [uncultured bacterium]KKT02874.1 MAG: glycyl-tRNA synthetase, glycyl-tRNA synthetase [Candidatus Peregrinibacteria bacterium GW2011_GWF2_43_17]KKT18798.1 MAG: Glycine-tRNA ligase [Candidatus Peregrinibacteria bacterium GW2011_GWA2_43_8]HAU39312.1 glycine--tRNA ligase [Candidatus Peregrinibacteria bacterium]
MPEQDLMDKVISLCKRRGFVFPGSEIYGGLANTWDYGPYGVELKNNLKRIWWKTFVQGRDDMVGVDAAILMNPRVWEASGHIENFSDPLVDCKSCKERFRGDKLIEEKLGIEAAAKLNLKDLTTIIHENKIPCPKCGKCNFTEARSFNCMFKTHQGVIEETASLVYLRPETAQGIFTNFKNVLNTSRKKLPFGIGQIGKSFRNEITPGNFTFRTREFEQMEIEYFIREKDWETLFDGWEKDCWDFYLGLGLKKENLRFRDHDKKELSHYSKKTKDIEYKFPFGWGELMGLAYRTDFDLKRHSEFSGEKLTYFEEGEQPFVPHVIEPSFGVERTVLTILLDAYCEEEVNGETRVVMKFNKKIAPITVAVLPLSNKLNEEASKVYKMIKSQFACEFDVSGSIGKRYRRQDEIGTPYCVTFDFDSLEDKSVTVRDRDTMKQERVKIEDLMKVF